MVYSNAVTTVSPTYANEVCQRLRMRPLQPACSAGKRLVRMPLLHASAESAAARLQRALHLLCKCSMQSTAGPSCCLPA